MSAAGSTSLSLSDIPFAYSLIGLLSIIYLEKALTDSLYIVALGGSLVGTFLLITHPVQRLQTLLFLTVNPKDMIYQPIGSKKYTIKASSVRSALQTTSIRFERDRIVAIFYFITILSLTSAALWAGSIEKVFEIDSQNFLWLAKIVVLVSFGIILYMNYAESRKFPDRVKMTAVYLEAIPYVNKAGMDTCLDNIGRALEVNDWVTVKEWLERMLMVLEGIRPR